MDLKAKIYQNWATGGAGALIAVSLGLGLQFVHFGKDVSIGQGLIQWSYDLPFQFRPDLKTEGVVIVYLDEESYRELKQDIQGAWDRALHAQLLQRLKQENAKLVVMDIVFTEHGSDPTNHLLAAAMKEHGKVLVGADYVLTGDAAVAPGRSVVYPIDVFRQAAAGVGIVPLLKDADYGVREHFPGGYEGPEFVPTLPWKSAELFAATITREPNQREKPRWLNYYGPPGFIPHVSYHVVVKPNYSPPPGFFQDKVVFVGKAPIIVGFVGEFKDEYRSPYTWWTGRFTSGVEIQATTFLNLVNRDWLQQLSPWVEFSFLLLIGVLFGFGLSLLRPLASGAVALLGMALITAFAFLLFWQARVWFGWLILVAVQIPFAFLWSVIVNSIQLYGQKKALEQSLSLHLSPARVKQIQKRPDLLRPGAEKQEVSILFSDIAMFSKVTARMEPEDLFKLLNKYFETALTCIHKTDGTVIKLIGDAIFAIWNAPFTQPDQQERACRAALLLREQLVQFDAQQHSLPLRTRVGLHTGYAYVGNVGSSTRFDYTAIGDPINMASRLEGLNKFLNTDVLATRDIQKIVESTIISRCVGHFKFKGVDRVVEVHELIGTQEQDAPTKVWRDAFADALFKYQRRAFDGAEAGFRRVLELHADDGPSRFYLEKIAELRKEPPPEEWAGEVELKEK